MKAKPEYQGNENDAIEAHDAAESEGKVALSVERAMSAYHAYGSITDFKNYQGKPMPEWKDLTDTIRAAWEAAANDAAAFLVPSENTVANTEPETSRADEARVSLDMAIDAYLEIYNAVVAKVPGEHAQSAIFAALVSGK